MPGHVDGPHRSQSQSQQTLGRPLGAPLRSQLWPAITIFVVLVTHVIEPPPCLGEDHSYTELAM